MAETIYTSYESQPVSYRDFKQEDITLANKVVLPASYDINSHLIELHIYTIDGLLLESITGYGGAKELGDSSSAGKTGTNVVYIDPVLDIQNYGYPEDNVTLVYNFLKPLFQSSFTVKEVSTDRTEIKIIPQLVNYNFTTELNEVKNRLTNDVYFNELRLNFGANNSIIGINIDTSKDGAIIIKLYEPLPVDIKLKATLSIVEEVSDPIAYTVKSRFIASPPSIPYLKGPNFNIDVEQENSTSTEYLDYTTLFNYPVTSSYHKAFTLVSGSGIAVSVNYADYSDFIHFSSAYERLLNFKYKLDLIKSYETQRAATGSLVSASFATSSNAADFDRLISNIVSKFDGYEKYLYFESSSYTWPKVNSTAPYINQDSNTLSSLHWFTSQSLSASLYDELNESRLTYTIPEFIRQDTANAPYSLFVDMVGQHFDNLWLYTKAVTDKYNADNRLEYGISRELIGEALKSFGVKLYNSNFSATNLTSMFLGEWYDSGSEQINTFVTASNQPTPDRDILDETYKRLYHNLPLLVKTKGTERGLRALINCFGIPSGSLEIRTFGGNSRTGSTPYYATAVSSSNKVRLNNTGSITPGNTLSELVSIVKVDSSTFTQDLHVIEAGFSPSYNIDEFIKQNITGSFNIDQYIGDPRYLYSTHYSNDTNGNLYRVAETLLSGSDSYDVFDYVRLIKFFDNQLFKMIKDFVPARDVITSGIIIKPHILNRSKVKSAELSWTQPEYTSSINTAFTTGSSGGVLEDYSTAYTASVPGLLGTISQIQNTGVEKINGELGGTVLTLYTGSLNLNNPFKKVNQPLLTYNITNTTNTGTFLTGSFAAGDLYIYIEDRSFFEADKDALPTSVI